MAGAAKDDQPTLSGSRVRLRPWRPDDAPAVFAACQDAEIQRWTEVPVPYHREDAEGYVGEVSRNTWANGGALFAVEPVDGGALIGAMALLVLRDGVGVAGYWTVAEHRGRGYTAEALRLLSAWVLDDLGARRIELVADVRNAGSCAVAESGGFRREGVLRPRSVHRGQPVDDVLYALLATDSRP